MKVLYFSLFIVLSDQLSKMWVKGANIPFLGIHFQGFQYGSSRPIFGDFLKLTYIENPGMAFGIDLGAKLFFSLFSILASIGIIVYLYKVRHEPLVFRTSLAMILGGAIGNLIDRVFYGVFYGESPLFYGKVVDFLDADFFNINVFGYHMTRWPVFNFADASVTCGVILLLLSQWMLQRKEAATPVLASPDQQPSSPESNAVSDGQQSS